jgi:amino acid adenylation domain-containing protein
MLVAMLAVWKIGGTYVPLHPTYPVERLHYMIRDSGVTLLLTNTAVSDVCGRLGGNVVCVDTDVDYSGEDSDSIESSAHSDDDCADLAYIIYTSGTTGRPKGTCITHRSVANLLLAMRRLLDVAKYDVVLAATTISFDIAALELFMPLICGARVHLVDSSTVLDPVHLGATIDASEVTIAQATPSVWKLLIDSGWVGNDQLKVLCGGEMLSPNLANALLQRSGCLWNVYGPTETTIWSSAWQVSRPYSQIPIGHPLDNTTIYVLDEDLRPVEPGVVGELFIGGEGVAQGYLNNDLLTKQCFIEDPYAVVPEAKLYRTGDLAHYDPSTGFVVHGRRDDQVKIHGHRIELSEVEAVLQEHPGVGQVGVVAREARNNLKELVGYVTALSDHLTSNELRTFMRRRVPSYLIPSLFVVLEELPMMPSGKVDRKRLANLNPHDQLRSDKQKQKSSAVEITSDRN